MNLSLQTALNLHACGIACIPVNANKVPLIKSWRAYMDTLPTEEETGRWFADGAALALCAGEVQCIDVDEKYQAGLMAAFEARVRTSGLADVWDRCLIQRTPSGGYHLVFRSEGEPFRNMKLAQKSAEEKHLTLIETRGAGGYFLIAPSEGYEVVQGDFEMLPVLTEEERSDLLDVARSFNARSPREAAQPSKLDDLKPGDDYDVRGDVEGLLTSHGWTKVNDVHWRRPGKDTGISASLGVIPGRFWVWSTSTAFESEHLYRPYAVYAVLEHGGDFREAARALKMQGYGTAKDGKLQDGPIDPRASLSKAMEEAREEETSEEDDLLKRALEQRFRYAENLQCGRSLLMIGDTVVATAGNLVAISAQAKAGKTALYSGAIASALRPGTFLHCSSPDQTGAVIHIDTEQSHYDAHRLGRTVLNRAGIRSDDQRYMAFRWRDFPVSIRKRALYAVCAEAVMTHGHIHSIWIDGIADFVGSVNDEQECNELVTEMMSLSTECDCMICCVIHLNPTSDSKSRGHLGSALERKAEANIRLNKNEEMVTEVWGEKMRGKPILKKDALCFAWDDEAKRHEVIEGAKKTSRKPLRMSQPDAQAHARKLAASRAWEYEEWWQSVMRETGYTGKDYKTQFRDYAMADNAVEMVDVTTGRRGKKPKLIGPTDEVLKLKVKLEKEYQEANQKEITSK